MPRVLAMPLDRVSQRQVSGGPQPDGWNAKSGPDMANGDAQLPPQADGSTHGQGSFSQLLVSHSCGNSCLSPPPSSSLHCGADTLFGG